MFSFMHEHTYLVDALFLPTQCPATDEVWTCFLCSNSSWRKGTWGLFFKTCVQEVYPYRAYLFTLVPRTRTTALSNWVLRPLRVRLVVGGNTWCSSSCPPDLTTYCFHLVHCVQDYNTPILSQLMVTCFLESGFE